MIILITASLSSNTHTTKLLDAKTGRLREQQNQYASACWSFLDIACLARLVGQAMYSQHLVCLGEPLVAAVVELLPPLFSEAWISCFPMTASSQQSSTELLVRWNARMESSSLRSCASHLRMIAWA